MSDEESGIQSAKGGFINFWKSHSLFRNSGSSAQADFKIWSSDMFMLRDWTDFIADDNPANSVTKHVRPAAGEDSEGKMYADFGQLNFQFRS